MKKSTHCIGHRGAMGYEPENTLLSIRKALQMGVDAVEFDLHFADGRLVVIHDESLERTTNGTGLVAEKSFAYLRSLDAGKGEQIPTVVELFALVESQVGMNGIMMNIELKGLGTAVPTATFIARKVAAGWDYARILVSSFRHELLQEIKALDQQIQIAPLLYKPLPETAAFAAEMQATAVNPWVGNVTKSFVQESHQRGLQVFVYTVNEIAAIKRLVQWGVDGIITNYPDRVQAITESLEATYEN